MDKCIKGKIDFLKIDVDRPELSVLKSGKQIIEKFKPLIMLEISPDMYETVGISHIGIVEWMTKLNYIPFKSHNKLTPFTSKKINKVRNIVAIPKY